MKIIPINQVLKGQWYVLVIKTDGTGQGLAKLIDDIKNQIIPTIKINNDMFLYKKYDAFTEYRIYFITLKNTKFIDLHIIGLNIKDVKIQQVTYDVVGKNIDIWKFRKLYDLEFINYYVSKIKLDCTEKFIERFKADYELYKDPDYFDKFIKTIKFDQKNLKKRQFNTTIVFNL